MYDIGSTLVHNSLHGVAGKRLHIPALICVSVIIRTAVKHAVVIIVDSHD